MTLKSRAISLVVIGIILVCLAVLIWADRTGRVTIFGSESDQEVTKTVESLEDWVKGKFDNSSFFTDGGLKLGTGGTTTKETNEPSGATGGSTGDTGTTTTVKTINDTGIKTTKITSSNCSSYTPSGWQNRENSAAYAFVYDTNNLEKSLGASYLVSGVTVYVTGSGLSAGDFYQNSYPEKFIGTTMKNNKWTGFKWISKRYSLGSNYYLKMWQATNPETGKEVRAIAQWTTWDLYGNSTSIDIGNQSHYVIVLRMGSANTDKWDLGYASVVYDVATSIRCNAQIKPNNTANSISTTEDYKQKGSSDVHDKLSEAWQEATMGYENVYDSDGNHYEAPLSAYNEVGPYGGDPGYYRQNGNDYIKLEPGFGF